MLSWLWSWGSSSKEPTATYTFNEQTFSSKDDMNAHLAKHPESIVTARTVTETHADHASKIDVSKQRKPDGLASFFHSFPFTLWTHWPKLPRFSCTHSENNADAPVFNVPYANIIDSILHFPVAKLRTATDIVTSAYLPIAKGSIHDFTRMFIDASLFQGFITDVVNKEYGIGFHEFLKDKLRPLTFHYTGSAVWKHLMHKCLALWKTHNNSTKDYPVGDIDIIVTKNQWFDNVHDICESILEELRRRFPKDSVTMEFSMGVVTYHVGDRKVTPLQLQFKPPSNKGKILKILSCYDADHLKAAFDGNSGDMYMHAATPYCWYHGETHYHFASTRTRYRARRMRNLGWNCKHRDPLKLDMSKEMGETLDAHRAKPLPVVPMELSMEQKTLFSFVGGNACDFVLPFTSTGKKPLPNRVMMSSARLLYSMEEGQLWFDHITNPNLRPFVCRASSPVKCLMADKLLFKHHNTINGNVLALFVNNNMYLFFRANKNPMAFPSWYEYMLGVIARYLERHEVVSNDTKVMVYYSKHQVFPRFSILPM